MTKEDELLIAWGRKRDEIIDMIEKHLDDVVGPSLFKKIMQLDWTTKELEKIRFIEGKI